MKCPKCGYVTFDHLEACSKCHAKLDSARESLGLGATRAAAAALEVEARRPTVARRARPRKSAAPPPARAREITLKEPTERVATAEPGLELDLEAAAAEAGQAAAPPAEETGEDSEPTLELEAVIEPVVLDEAPDEGPQEAVQGPVEEAVQEPVEEAVQEPVEEAAREPAEEAAEEPVKEAVQEPVEEAAREPVEKAAQEPVEEAAQEPVEEAVQEPVEEEEAAEPAATTAAEDETPPEAAASGPKKEGAGIELPDELSALVAAAEEAVGEETAAEPQEGAAEPQGDVGALTQSEDQGEDGADKADLTPAPSGPAVDLELDEELRKFLEQEGTSLEELESKGDDDEPPPAAGGGGEGEDQQARLLDDEGGEAGGSRSACEAEAPVRAAFWLRALALGIDGSLLLVLLLALLASAAAAFYWAAERLGTAADPMSLLRLALIMVPLGVPLAVSVLGLTYFTCFHGLAGSTPGKMLLGLEVRRLDGGHLSCGRALLRSASYLPSALPLAMGFLWAIGGERLAWHDLMAGSEVLRA